MEADIPHLLIHTNILKYTLQKFEIIFKYSLKYKEWCNLFGLINRDDIA